MMKPVSFFQNISNCNHNNDGKNTSQRFQKNHFLIPFSLLNLLKKPNSQTKQGKNLNYFLLQMCYEVLHLEMMKHIRIFLYQIASWKFINKSFIFHKSLPLSSPYLSYGSVFPLSTFINISLLYNARKYKSNKNFFILFFPF